MQVKSIVVAAALATASVPLVASAQFFHGGGSGHWGGHAKGMHGGPIASNPTIVADRTTLHSAFSQLTSDARAGNTSAIGGDQAAITTALGKLQSDRAALVAAIQASAAVQGAKAALKTDHLAIEKDRVQLRSDQIAGNSAGVDADKQALATDMAKMRTDFKALADAIAAITI